MRRLSPRNPVAHVLGAVQEGRVAAEDHGGGGDEVEADGACGGGCGDVG
jgi:hypothetical protein